MILSTNRRLFGWVAAAMMSGAAAAQISEPPPRPQDTAAQFVSAARDLGIRVAGRQTATDVLEIRTLLEAASRIRPEASEPYVWLYELATLRNDADAAAAALDKLIETDPANENAYRLWVEQVPAGTNTIEARSRRLTERLAQSPPPFFAALIHAALARISQERMEEADARKHFEEAAARCPDCPEVSLLALELVSPTEDATVRLGAMLGALRLNPMSPELAWDTGAILDEAGFAEDALRFYEYARAVSRAAGQPLPIDSFRLLQLSYNALGRGNVRDAIDYGFQSGRSLKDSLEPLFYLFWLTDRYVGKEQANEVAAQARKYFERMEDPDKWPANLVAQAAWYYVMIELDPPKALSLITAAMKRDSGDPFVRRVYGWALSISGQLDEAAMVLEPIRRDDPYAAVRMAMNRRAVGDDAGAMQYIHDLRRIPPVGQARALLDKEGLPPAASQPVAMRNPRMAELLSEFDSGILDFYRDSPKYLEATVRPVRPAVEPGEPWMFEFALANRGTFAITLGPGAMINPVFLVSVELEGDKKLEYPQLLTIPLDRVCVLQPKQRVSVQRQIEFGPLRAAIDRTPQRLWRATIRAILDPVQAPGGRWEASPVGQTIAPAYLNRPPAGTTDQAWHARFSQLTGESPPARFLALEQIGLLLGEAQRGRMGRLSYDVRPIPEERVSAALRATIESTDWEIRARTLMALSHAGLDQAMLEAVRTRLSDEHWAVRLLAVRLLARMGAAFASQAQEVAASDADPLVQRMATIVLTRLGVEALAANDSKAAQED